MVPSAAEALLQAAREPPQALVIECQDGGSSVRQVLAALQRSMPTVPVYAVVPPENEPLAARLLDEGLADYFVLPNDVRRLPDVLAARAEPPVTPAAEGPDAARPARRFDAACRLAGLALEQPTPLFCDGARIVFEALGAARGCAFWWSPEADRLDLAVIVGGSESLGADDREAVRASAARTLRTGEVLIVPAGSAGAPPEGLMCVPVRDESFIHGVLCLPARVGGRALSSEDHRTAETLAGALANLVAAALRREEYARLALRDAETGLLQADPFQTYLEGRLAYAHDCGDELALVLLEAEVGVPAGSITRGGREGRAVREVLETGWEGGRIADRRYAVVIGAVRPGAAVKAGEPATPDQSIEAAVRRLRTAMSRACADRLRTAIARFPQDGPTVEALVGAAERRLEAASHPDA